MKPGLKSIHDIHTSYINSNTYFVVFVIPGVNKSVMPCVNSIYELISYNKFTCVCVCNRQAVHEVFTNHEVVVFQPQTGTAQYLGSFASYNFYSNPPAPPVLTLFLDFSISLLHPTSPPSVTVCCNITSMFCTRSPPLFQ